MCRKLRLLTMKPDQERVHSLLVDTIGLLCRNGLNFQNEVKVQAVIGITVDKEECFVVHINKCYERLEEENCENEELLKESVQQIAEVASATPQPVDEAPISVSVQTIQSTTQQQQVSVNNLSLSPSAAEQNKSEHQQQASASNVVHDENVSKSEIPVVKSGSVKHETVDECAEFNASRARVNMRDRQRHDESDECDDSSVMTTDSVMCQQISMTGKQHAVNRRDMQQSYYKSSQPTRHRPQYYADAYQPKRKKRNPCEDLFDTEDDSCDDFNAGQQYMYIDAGSLRSRPKLSKRQQQNDVFFDPHSRPSMSALGEHVRVFIFTTITNDSHMN